MDYHNIGRWFGVVDRQSQNYITKACKEKGIDYQEYILLCNLYENEGISQEELARIVMADKAAVARSLKSLEGKGLVKRIPGDRDRRIKKLHLTEAGWALENFIRGVLQKWIDFLSAGLTEEQVKVILDGLKTISERALMFADNDER